MRVFHLIEKQKIVFSVALILICLSVGSILIRGLNWGIDFVGGTIITIDLHTEFDTTETRQITDKYDKYANITYAGDGKDMIVISSQENLDAEQRNEIFKDFKEAYDLEDADLISVDTVSPTVGSEMTREAWIAVGVAILLMLVYIWFRFELFFGISAILMLIFDILNVVGFYALFQIQVNTPFIAAILTVLGYSINGTIVVFDRIRENQNLGIYGHDYTKLIDTSVTQTLKRTLYTTATTLLAILSLYIFGVSEIQDFALPIMVGIISGAFSSICMASPVWLWLQKKFPNVTRRKKQGAGGKKRKNEKIII